MIPFKIKLLLTFYFSYLQLPTCKILFTLPSVSWINPFSFPRVLSPLLQSLSVSCSVLTYLLLYSSAISLSDCHREHTTACLRNQLTAFFPFKRFSTLWPLSTFSILFYLHTHSPDRQIKDRHQGWCQTSERRRKWKSQGEERSLALGEGTLGIDGDV